MLANRKVKKPARNVFSERSRAFVNERFDGNVSAAAAALGCSYDQLYAAVNGMRKKPNLTLVAILATYTATTIDQWVRP